MFRSIALAVGCSALLVCAGEARATQRTFVSVLGNDVNTASNCSNASPCRGFGAALTVTDSGGEIVVKDSGGYGAVSIDKSVSIIAPEGVYAGISVFSGDGIGIATAGVNVRLKGLTINGLGGTRGIHMTNGASLTVEGCVIRNFSSFPYGSGIAIDAGAQVHVLDSLLQGTYVGVSVQGGAKALLSRTRLLDGGYALSAFTATSGQTVAVELAHAEIRNFVTGASAEAYSGGTVVLRVSETVIVNNTYGVNAIGSGGSVLASVTDSLVADHSDCGIAGYGGGTQLIVGSSRALRNLYAFCQGSSAVVESTGDNTVRQSLTADTTGTVTTVGKI
jgi:hypothetical protein